MVRMKDLTKVQNRALHKLICVGRKATAYEIQERVSVLDELVRKGYAKKYGGGIGTCFSPATTYRYKAMECIGGGGKAMLR